MLAKQLALGVRINEPPVAVTSFITLAPGGTLTLDDGDRSPASFPARLDVDRRGERRRARSTCRRSCARSTAIPMAAREQIASRAMPLVYLNEVAVARRPRATIRRSATRVVEAIAGVLANQSTNGGFGLWGPGGDDFWLDAYRHRFPQPARQEGATTCPPQAFDLALDNLRNRLAYASDFETGGEDIAYALYVLAAQRPRLDRRPPLLRRDQARGLRDAARQGADRRGARALWRQGRAPTRAFRAAVGDLAGGSDRRRLAGRLRLATSVTSAAVLTLASETARSRRSRGAVAARRSEAVRPRLYEHAGGRLVAARRACADRAI